MAGSRRLLFVSVPMHGHMNPLLQPASILANQGHEVLFLCYEQLRATVEKAGITFKSLGPDCIDRKQQSNVDTYATKKTKMLAAAALYTGWEEDMFHSILQTCRAYKPDVIVADMATLAAHDAAESLQLPLALIGSMPLTLALDLCGYSTFNSGSSVPFEHPGVMVMHERMSLWERHVINPLCKKLFAEGSVMHLPMLRARDALRESFGLPDMPLGAGPFQLSRRIPQTITILATSWLMEAKRELPHGWHLVGPMGCSFTHDFPPKLPPGQLQAFLDKAQADGVPAMLVATGTTTVLPINTLQAIAEAFQSLPEVRFVWSLKQESQSQLSPDFCPPNMLILPWVPQTAVLGHPAVKGFFCHGGHTTTNEALAVGVPLLCMPFGGDQLVVAQHIKDHGYGLQIGLVNHTREAIAAKIQRLLNGPEFAAASTDASRKIRACCGAALAAWLLADFARGSPDVEPDSADSADDTVSDVVSATGGTGVGGRGFADGTTDTSWWPKLDNHRGCGLARSAVNAH